MSTIVRNTLEIFYGLEIEAFVSVKFLFEMLLDVDADLPSFVILSDVGLAKHDSTHGHMRRCPLHSTSLGHVQPAFRQHVSFAPPLFGATLLQPDQSRNQLSQSPAAWADNRAFKSKYLFDVALLFLRH